MRHSNFLLPGASILTLLCACTTPATYQPPQVDMPAQYMGSPAIDTGFGGKQVDLTHWWTAFDDPMIAALVERALAQNLDLQQAEARVAQARAASQWADADQRPQGLVSGQAAGAYLSKETPIGQIGSSFPGFDRTAQSYDGNLSASWEVDVFGGKEAARSAVYADWQASMAAASAARLTIAAQTADTYITIRTLQARLQLARDQRDIQRQLVDLVALQYRKGLAAEVQLRQAEGALAFVESAIPELEQNLDIAMNALDILLGQQPGTVRPELAQIKPIPAPPPVSSAGGPPELLRRRPDIIAAERRLFATDRRLAAAMTEYYPKFSIGGLLGFATMGLGGIVNGDGAQANGAFGLRWRLFDFGRIDAEIAASEGAKMEALAAYRLSVLRASEDVENAITILIKQQDRVQLLQGGTQSLTRARASAFAGYKGGVSSVLDVLDADRQLLTARDAEIQARSATSRAAVASFRALGGGWDATI